jgi:YVTN family beta-propeller protein
MKQLLPIFAALFIAGGQAPASPDLLLIVNKTDSTLTVLDAATQQVKATIPTRQGPHEVVASPDGRLALVSDYVGTPEDRGHTITVVDLERLEALEPIDLLPNRAPHGMEITSDGRWLWATTEVTASVVKIDLSTRKLAASVDTSPLRTHMIALAEGAGKAYASSIGGGAVAVIDMSSGKMLKQVPTGAGAEGIDVTPDGRHVLVTNRAAGTLSVIDTSSDEVVRSFEVGDFPIRVKVMPDGTRALVSNAKGNEIAEVDLRGWSVARRLAVGRAPIGVLITPEGRTAYVANTESHKATVVDLVEWKVTGELQAGREPDGLAWAGRGDRR